MLKQKTSLPATKHTETDTDKYFTYLVSHVTRTPDIQPIATIAPDQSARRTWTTPQITILAILATLTLIALWCFGTPVLTLIFALVTILYVALLALSASWMIAVSRAQPETPFDESIIADLAKAPWPRYTVLCPLYHEKNIVPQFVQAMQALDYPQDCLQVLFLTEQDDRETRATIRAMNLPANFEVLIVPQGTPKTKPRACNYGLTKATGEYVVIFDAEDIPDPLQLKKAVLTFASNPVNVACVQARLNFYNPSQNLLTRFFTIEYSLWFDLILPGLQRLGFSLPLGGTSNHFRIAALKALGGWDAFNVTEDCDLGLKLARYGFKTIMLDSTTYEEANSRVFSWIKQRSRWIKGYMQTYLVHTRSPQKTVRQGKIKDLLSLHLFVGAGSVVLLINPVMWCMFVVYLVFRPVALYHHLFPWPVLYAGMLCFLVGNFLPIYVSMIACMKREQYSLVKWCLLLPLYWILASIAAFLAGYELLTNPHKWRKTEHGLHLKHKASTQKIAAISMKRVAITPAQGVKGNVTASIRAMSTVLMPAMVKEKVKKSVERDPWLWVVIGLAIVCSISATVYSYLHHDILLYSDAYSHMRIARGVIDSLTPGFGQLGNSWLFLPHLLMIPFIWNDFLWRSGLAGSIPSMICYVAASVYLYLSAKRLTKNSCASLIGVLVFALNPNVMYIQTTPLSESICFATFAAAGFYFIAWAQENKIKYLLLASASSFLVTIARYDGWFLFLSLFVLAVIIGLLRRVQRKQIEANVLIFGLLGSAGIVLWLAWNTVIFGSPLEFENGAYSSRIQMEYNFPVQMGIVTHNIFQSIWYYGYTCLDIVGPIVSILALVGIMKLVIGNRNTPETLAALSFLTPLSFYVFSFYTGQVASLVPGTSNILFNSRFGTEAMLPAALFIAILANIKIPTLKKWIDVPLQIVLVFLVILQVALIARSGILVLDEGEYGGSCTARQAINAYLAQHYNGGLILEDTYLGSPNESQEVGIHLDKIIYQGSGVYWKQALHNPGIMVDWVLIGERSPDSPYPIQVKTGNPLFASQFQLVVRSQGFDLYQHRGISALPNRPIPTLLTIEHPYCGTGKHP